jgi:hypothetical protein
MFIGSIDDLTPLHLSAMKCLERFSKEERLQGGATLPLKLGAIFRASSDNTFLCKQVLSQLDSLGYLREKAIWIDETTRSIRSGADVITELGKAFLKFIAFPSNDE